MPPRLSKKGFRLLSISRFNPWRKSYLLLKHRLRLLRRIFIKVSVIKTSYWKMWWRLLIRRKSTCTCLRKDRSPNKCCLVHPNIITIKIITNKVETICIYISHKPPITNLPVSTISLSYHHKVGWIWTRLLWKKHRTEERKKHSKNH